MASRTRSGPDHWRLRRCWLTSKGTFCISTEPATVTREGEKLKMKAPANRASAKYPIELGGTFREVHSVRHFSFALSTGGQEVFLAAGSEEQRDEWFYLLGHFADADRRQQPPPKSTSLETSPRTGGGTHVVDVIEPADIPMPKPEKTLKPILKSKPMLTSGPVPAIRIPRRLPMDPMEALTSTRRSSIRFDDAVERREFTVSKAEPVPHKMRAHESRKPSKPEAG